MIKIHVRVTDDVRTAVTRKSFDELPSREEAESVLYDTLAQLNVELPKAKTRKKVSKA